MPTCLFSFVSGAEIHRSEPWLAQTAAVQTSIRKATVHFNTLNRRRCIQGPDGGDQSLSILNMCKYVYRPIDPSVIKTKLLCFCFCRSDTRRTQWRPWYFWAIISRKSSASFLGFPQNKLFTQTLASNSPIAEGDCAAFFLPPPSPTKSSFSLINLAKFFNKMTLWKQQTLLWIILWGSQQTHLSSWERGGIFNKQACAARMSQR